MKMVYMSGDDLYTTHARTTKPDYSLRDIDTQIIHTYTDKHTNRHINTHTQKRLEIEVPVLFSVARFSPAGVALCLGRFPSTGSSQKVV